MSEKLPLDPLAGVVNYIEYNVRCPWEMASDIVRDAAASMGVGAWVLPNHTEADNDFVRAVVGLDSVEQQTPQTEEPADVNLGTIAPPRHIPTIVCMTRQTGSEDYAHFGAALQNLHPIVRDLTDRLN